MGTDDDFADWEALGHGTPTPQGATRLDAIVWVAVLLAVLTVAGMVLLRPSGASRDLAQLGVLGVPSELYAAAIASVTDEACFDGADLVCTSVTFELKEGPDVGAEYSQSFPPSSLNPEFRVGDIAILSRRSPNGTVTAVQTEACEFDPSATCRLLTLSVGEDPPQEVTYAATILESAARLGVGDDAIVEFLPDDELTEALSVQPPDVEIAYQFSGDFQRRPLLLWATALFAAAVIAVGKWRGATALAGLAASVGIILLFVIPAILDGRSPVLVAVAGATAIGLITLYVSHGFTRMTTVALLGMVAALVLTALLSAVAVSFAQFSGFASEESTLLSLFEGIDVGGLLLAGIVLGTAGALDDVTVTQASAVWALHGADPQQSPATLYSRAMRIGRDHIASTVNTLLLAYAGASLPLLILFVLSDQSLGAIANSEVVAVEIVRTLVGSIGLVAAVPITTWLAARSAGSATTAAPAHEH